MEAIVAAVFEEPSAALNALEELGPRDPATDVVSVQVIEGNEDAKALFPTRLRGRGGGVLGLVVGAFGGVFLGVVMLSLLRASGSGESLLTGALFAGAFYGGLAGLLAAKPRPRLPLRRLARKLEAGRIMVSVGVNNVLAAHRVRNALVAHGALATAVA